MAVIPVAEVTLAPDVVYALLADQCPDLAGRGPVTPFANGWDNEMFTLGQELLVRLPRRAVAAPLVENEARWLPHLQRLVGVPLPVPLFLGGPGHGYPWRWTVVPRLPGTGAARVPAAGRSAAAVGLADFFAGLHRPAPVEAPANPFRGVALMRRAAAWEPHLRAAVGDHGWLRWQQWAAAPAWPGPAVWLHGDPHPLNLLLDGAGQLGGVVDWGDVTAGDPAGDLAMAWLTFDAPARGRFRAACDASGRYDAAIWVRARAWALGLAGVFLRFSDDQPDLAAVGRHGIGQVLAEPD